MAKVHKLDCHEMLETPDKSGIVMRVPGGWIYAYRHGNLVTSSVFVPYNKEFIEVEGEGGGDN